MPDFDQTKPDKKITDPKNSPIGEYPRHLFKFVSDATPTSLVVAWAGKAPIHNDIVDAFDDHGKAELVKDGWSLTAVLKDPAEKKAAKKDDAK